MNDKAKTIDVELRIKADWKDSRIAFNNSSLAESKIVMRSRNYMGECLWYPMVDIFNFVSAEDNTMFKDWQKVSLTQTPNNDGVSTVCHFKKVSSFSNLT